MKNFLLDKTTWLISLLFDTEYKPFNWKSWLVGVHSAFALLALASFWIVGGFFQFLLFLLFVAAAKITYSFRLDEKPKNVRPIGESSE